VTGLTGLGTNPPPQFEQTFPRIFSTQSVQNVHSNEQIRASCESGGNATLQCSQVGLSSNMVELLDNELKTGRSAYFQFDENNRRTHAGHDVMDLARFSIARGDQTTRGVPVPVTVLLND
jgi:hypothetical protein